MIDVDYNEYKKTLEENMKLIVENHKLQEIINSAIEFIEEAQEQDEDKESCSLYVPKLLEILKGADK